MLCAHSIKLCELYAYVCACVWWEQGHTYIQSPAPPMLQVAITIPLYSICFMRPFVYTVYVSWGHSFIQCMFHEAIPLYSICFLRSFLYTVYNSWGHLSIHYVFYETIPLYSISLNYLKTIGDLLEIRILSLNFKKVLYFKATGYHVGIC